MPCSSKRLVSWTFLLWGFALVPALAIRSLLWENSGAALLEGILILVAVLIFLSLRPVNSFLTALPSFFQIFSAVFFTAALFSQLSEINNVVFPFTAWHMYAVTDKTQKVHFFQYEGVTGSGKRIELNLPREYPLLQKGMLTYQLEYFGKIFETQPEIPTGGRQSGNLSSRLAQ